MEQSHGLRYWLIRGILLCEEFVVLNLEAMMHIQKMYFTDVSQSSHILGVLGSAALHGSVWYDTPRVYPLYII